ncbi:hypothetical protein JYT53_01150 [Cytophagaceae bacterium AH-315-L13]|nr:hypothetical protein [Cytophagaceae bacterium AH-315-L13]
MLILIKKVKLYGLKNNLLFLSAMINLEKVGGFGIPILKSSEPFSSSKDCFFRRFSKTGIEKRSSPPATHCMDLL